MKYNGKGFFPGDKDHERVPARDLTPEEVLQYGKDFLLSLGLYEEVKPKKKKEVKYGK